MVPLMIVMMVINGGDGVNDGDGATLHRGGDGYNGGSGVADMMVMVAMVMTVLVVMMMGVEVTVLKPHMYQTLRGPWTSVG